MDLADCISWSCRDENQPIAPFLVILAMPQIVGNTDTGPTLVLGIDAPLSRGVLVIDRSGLFDGATDSVVFPNRTGPINSVESPRHVLSLVPADAVLG